MLQIAVAIVAAHRHLVCADDLIEDEPADSRTIPLEKKTSKKL
jgi:hypothetical protein